MESIVKVRAGQHSIERFFEANEPYVDTVDWLLVKYVAYIGGGWWKLVVRHPEFDENLSGRSYKSIGGLVHALESKSWKQRAAL